MNYKFPHIKHIDDVLPAIAGCDEILVADRGDHTTINYVVVTGDTFPPVVIGGYKPDRSGELHAAIRRECRGMIFDQDGYIIRRPYHKFFNVNEREETLAENVDLSWPHVILEKLDGSMIAPYRATRFGPILWGTRMGDTEVSDQPTQWVNENRPEYIDFCNEIIDRGCTPIFEWTSRKQRIVLDYPEDNLILTAVRDNITGEYLDIF